MNRFEQGSPSDFLKRQPQPNDDGGEERSSTKPEEEKKTPEMETRLIEEFAVGVERMRAIAVELGATLPPNDELDEAISAVYNHELKGKLDIRPGVILERKLELQNILYQSVKPTGNIHTDLKMYWLIKNPLYPPDVDSLSEENIKFYLKEFSTAQLPHPEKDLIGRILLASESTDTGEGPDVEESYSEGKIYEIKDKLRVKHLDFIRNKYEEDLKIIDQPSFESARQALSEISELLWPYIEAGESWPQDIDNQYSEILAKRISGIDLYSIQATITQRLFKLKHDQPKTAPSDWNNRYPEWYELEIVVARLIQRNNES